ncbi:hypothetical protein ACWT_1851 [Actinoplanes sp. SE50]|uniref:hypothetical protein n=1 Tax=unclassified Actinoplanes TaxID=2626549 RepID=UPI00023EBB30|nr:MULTISPECIES: hypothetical protein [unclassified Actinoplanes]AEV82870.1 hypothetical protein ACPL_1973 [Actinoplanes sp. SE50/110]ATO81266.1 hypothetical protein ACWT_1851 [Actinoplanes sp. SE50]SLL98673.1 hypothetical protein ACSP50_1900 [Actinoplanes sp. SE50/110]
MELFFRLLMNFGALGFFFGVVALFDHQWLVGGLLIAIGLPTAVIPVAIATLRSLRSWGTQGAAYGSLDDPVLRRRIKALGAVLVVLGLVAFLSGATIEALIYAANHAHPPIPLPLILLFGLIPSGLLMFLGYSMVNAGRLTLAGDAEGTDAGFRLGWILTGFCVVFGGAVTDPRPFWHIAGLIAIPTGVTAVLSCLALRALRKPMTEARHRYFEAREAQLRAERAQP